MIHDHWFVFLFITLAAWVAVKVGKLTLYGGVAGWFVGSIIFLGAHYTGLAILAAFFVMGTTATSWRQNKKENTGLVRSGEAKRTAGQVFSNGGVGACAALLMLFSEDQDPLLGLMLAASFSSAAADTLSSELGMLYGKRCYNILTLKKDKRGENGVISVEGILFGLAGSVGIAMIYTIGHGWSNSFIWIIIAGTIGNLTDSILGATLERKSLFSNNSVNFLNTLIAAISVCLSLL